MAGWDLQALRFTVTLLESCWRDSTGLLVPFMGAERMKINKTGTVTLNLVDKNTGNPQEKVLRARRVLRKVANTSEIQDAARQAGLDAIRALKRIVNNPLTSDVARISAAQTLLDRGHGKPTQTNINAMVNTDGAPTQIADEELGRRITETLTRIEALTRRKREKIKSVEQPADVRQFH